MPELVDLIVGDILHTGQLAPVSDILLRRCDNGNTGTGESQLGGGCKFIDHIGSASLGTQGNHIPERLELTFKFVDTVGVIPHNDKIRSCGLQVSQTVNALFRINIALGIGELGNAPDTLYCRVFYQLFNGVHIRAVYRHIHRDHFKAKGFRDSEMTVITGHGANEL